MQKHALAEKKKVFWDGVEIDGLSRVQEITLEKSTIDAAEFKRIRKIQSDITTLPIIEMDYIIKRDNNALEFFEKFYNDNEVKDCIVVRTDAHGVEFARRLLQSCECIKKTEPAYEAGSPTLAKITISIVPWEIKNL